MIQMISQPEDLEKVAPLFDHMNDTLILSAFQGCMGIVFADMHPPIQSAGVFTADFCFLVGEPDEALLTYVRDQLIENEIIIIPESKAIEDLIDVFFQGKAEKFTRYAIKKEPDVFDRKTLIGYIEGLPKQYTLEWIDEQHYEHTKLEPWSCDLCGNYADYEDFKAHGLGVVALHEGQLVSGVSAYTYYLTGIEIEIDTKESYRRQGLALACASKLILECLDRGLYPSWDAHNLGSVALAEKLGYHFDHPYVAYYLEKC